MSFAATINYYLRANGYSGSGVQPLGERFVMTDEERAASRRGHAAIMSYNDVMREYSAVKAGITSADSD